MQVKIFCNRLLRCRHFPVQKRLEIDNSGAAQPGRLPPRPCSRLAHQPANPPLAAAAVTPTSAPQFTAVGVPEGWGARGGKEGGVESWELGFGMIWPPFYIIQ